MVVPLLRRVIFFSTVGLSASHSQLGGAGAAGAGAGHSSPIASSTQEYLEPLVFERLPVGSIRPSGWLQRQLQTAADGYTGHLCDWYDLCANSTWMGGAEEAPNPEVLGYWLNGASALAFQIDDEHLASVVYTAIDYILEHAQPDGLLGVPLVEQPQCVVHRGNQTCKPPRFDNGTLYWSKSLVVFALQHYAEGNKSDTRTLPALERHFAAIADHLTTTPPAMWGASRWVESALGMQWMVDHGLGTPRLLEALHSLKNQSTALYDWPTRFLEEGGPWEMMDPEGNEKELHHGVNLAEAIKVGAVWYRVSRDERDLDNTRAALDHLTRIAGSPSGAFIADEIYTPPNTAARGTETCNVVETMWSMENAFSISGNVSYADRLERLAYNALPAALWPDITANVYLQMTNMIMAKDTPSHYWPHDGPKSTIYGLHRCCTSNFNQGWPKYAQSIVQQSVADDGLAVAVYAPANATAIAAGGGATVVITTDYPFSDTVEIRVTSKRPFPLHLRIPAWVDGATISVDEGPPKRATTTGAFHTVDTVGGPSGSIVVLTMHNSIRVEEGGYNDSSVSIHRGPLLFAMDIGNNVTSVNSSNGGSPAGMDQFQEYQVEPTKPWNMALDADKTALHFVGAAEPLGVEQPFSPEHAPVRIKARGRLLPYWGMLNYSASPPPMSPVHSVEPFQDIVLLPFGSTNIRMAQLPTLA